MNQTEKTAQITDVMTLDRTHWLPLLGQNLVTKSTKW